MASKKKPAHFEIADTSGKLSEPAINSPDDDLTVSVSIPSQIDVRMVDASTLGDYEIWLFCSSSLLSFVTGFLVAYVQETNPDKAQVLGAVTILFSVMFIFALVMTWSKRRCLNQKQKTVALMTSKAVIKRS